MCGDSSPIDLTAGEEGPSSPSKRKWKRRRNNTADTKDANIAEDEVQHAAAKPEGEEVSKGRGKRKRSWAADRAEQAEAKKQQLKTQKAEVREAKAAKKTTKPKREDQFGKAVRYSTNPSLKTRERMERAMPSERASMYNSAAKPSFLAMQPCLL